MIHDVMLAAVVQLLYLLLPTSIQYQPILCSEKFYNSPAIELDPPYSLFCRVRISSDNLRMISTTGATILQKR
jgi:hypothetical protein